MQVERPIITSSYQSKRVTRVQDKEDQIYFYSYEHILQDLEHKHAQTSNSRDKQTENYENEINNYKF